MSWPYPEHRVAHESGREFDDACANSVTLQPRAGPTFTVDSSCVRRSARMVAAMLPGPAGGTGRRERLRSVWPKGRAGSSPAPGTGRVSSPNVSLTRRLIGNIVWPRRRLRQGARVHARPPFVCRLLGGAPGCRGRSCAWPTVVTSSTSGAPPCRPQTPNGSSTTAVP